MRFVPGAACISTSTCLDTPALRRAQRLVDATVWPVLAGGCHTGHDTSATIANAGFEFKRPTLALSRVLTDFDPGAVSRDASGRTVREYEFVTTDKEIEVAPGHVLPRVDLQRAGAGADHPGHRGATASG